MNHSTLLLVALALAALTLGLGVAAVTTLTAASARSESRLALVGGRPTSARGRSDALDALLGRIRVGRAMSVLLGGAGLSWRPSQLVLGVLGAMVVVFLVGLPLVGRISTVVLVLSVPLLTHRYLLQRQAKRTERFIGQLPEVARVLANSSSAGLSVPRGLELAAREISEPAARELGIVTSQLHLGRGLDFAMADLSARLPSRELDVLVRTLIIQSRSGGALVSALRDIATALEERRQLRREAKTAVSGAVFGGYIVIFLGVGSVILMNLIRPGVIDELAGSALGAVVLLTSAVLYVVGWVLMRFVTRVDL